MRKIRVKRTSDSIYVKRGFFGPVVIFSGGWLDCPIEEVIKEFEKDH